MKKLFQNKSGFTLIEILVSTLILSSLTVSVYNLLLYTLKVSADNKSRMSAIIIANKRMEYIRNLPYDSVGTTAGIVPGVIPDNENVNLGNGSYSVNTFVQYEDDSYDGVDGGTPNDVLPTDYKQVRIRVGWTGAFGHKNITVFTKIAPRGMESNAGGGTLSILVFNASGVPVENAEVHIENNALAPAINFDAETNALGRLNLPGAPAAVESYEITVTKAGYSTDYTSDRDAVNLNPSKPHATIIEGVKTEISFTIDLLGTLNVRTITADLPDNWQINTDATSEAQTNSRLIIDPSGNIYVVWQDYRSASASKIYAQKYNSLGAAQWPNPASPADVNIAPANDTVVPDIAVDSAGNLYISWHDESTGNKEAYLVKRDSSDGSNLWGAEKKINTLADSDDQSFSRIAIANDGVSDYVAVVWQDDRNGDNDIFLQIFDTDGNYLLSPEARINSNPSSDGTDQYEPIIAADISGNLFAAWTDTRDGDKNIYAGKYDLAGAALWSPANIKINADATINDQYAADAASDSLGNAFFVWTDERNADKDIYAAKCGPDGAALWTPANIKINTDDASAAQSSPSLAINSSNILFFVWQDDRNGDNDIYAQKYDESGTALWSNDIRINVDTANSSQTNPDVTINPSTGMPYASWEDDRSSDLDIYASSFDNYGAETNIADVPITIIGGKKIGDNPVIYKYDHNFTTDSIGNLSLIDIEWDSYNITLQTGYIAYHIVMADPPLPANLSPDSTETVKIYLEP